jgi:hypothetical protein
MSSLSDRLEGVLERAGQFFMGKSPQHAAAVDIARHLNELGVDYAVVGAMALGAHGFERFTSDVDVLLTREGLARFKAAFLGRGYLEVFEGSKGVRDTVNNVKVDFLLTGDFPGDGTPKTVAFPDPRDVSIEGDKFRVVTLEKLVELKLASGISRGVLRMKDIADIVELIKAVKPPRALGEKLDPYVRTKYLELWDAVAAAPLEDY